MDARAPPAVAQAVHLGPIIGSGKWPLLQRRALGNHVCVCARARAVPRPSRRGCHRLWLARVHRHVAAARGTRVLGVYIGYTRRDPSTAASADGILFSLRTQFARARARARAVAHVRHLARGTRRCDPNIMRTYTSEHHARTRARDVRYKRKTTRLWFQQTFAIMSINRPNAVRARLPPGSCHVPAIMARPSNFGPASRCSHCSYVHVKV